MTLQILVPVEDYHLLTPEERRLAAGLAVDDASRDTELEYLSLEAAEWVATLCGISAADGYPPTLLRERVRDIVESYGQTSFALSRRFVWVSETDPFVLSMNEVPLDASYYRLDTNMGRVSSMMHGVRGWWGYGPVVVEYTAGLDPTRLPPVVKAVARDFIGFRLTQQDINPLERSVAVEGIDSVTYRDPADGQNAFVQAAMQRLLRYSAVQTL